MTRKIIKLIVILNLITINGCANTQNFNDAISTWTGVDRDNLFKSWGPPDVRANLKNGGEIIEYRKQRHYKKQTNSNNKGAAHALGYKFGIWLAGGSKPSGCTIRFHISPSGIITKFHFIGNDCRANDEKKAALSHTK